MRALNIVFTRKADDDELAIYKYISHEFGQVYANRFRAKLMNLLRTLSNQPFIGRSAKNDPSLRVIVISKQNKIIYKLIDKSIIIIRILNSKRDISKSF